MLKLLENTNQSVKLYIFKVYILAICTGLSIAFVLKFSFPNAEAPAFEVGAKLIVGAVFLGPISETILMFIIIYLIRKVISNTLYISLTSALIWGGLHSLQVPLWGVSVFPLFFLLSMAYQYWDNHSRKLALFVVTVIHALNNATGIVILAFES